VCFVTVVLTVLCCAQGGSEKLSDEAIEETLEKVVKLLAYISDKDLFAEFYRKRLARRLLQVSGASGTGADRGGAAAAATMLCHCPASPTSPPGRATYRLHMLKHQQARMHTCVCVLSVCEFATIAATYVMPRSLAVAVHV
jgi:hypothetical protein